MHDDYHHETLEELREREKTLYLIAVSENTVCKMMRIHLQSLCAPFREITEERYFDYMDVLPSAIPGISFSWESLTMRASTGSVSRWMPATLPDYAPLPRQEMSWNGRWTVITGTSHSGEAS